jgi:SAM-dependent methyltransferase
MSWAATIQPLTTTSLRKLAKLIALLSVSAATNLYHHFRQLRIFMKPMLMPLICNLLLNVPKVRKHGCKSCLSIRQPPPHYSLLDIGCATGIFLNCAARYMRVEGIELSQWAADTAPRRHRVDRQTLAMLNSSQKFNIITLWGVIEHIENPRSEIRSAKAHLVKDGLLFIYTGDRSASVTRILGKRWWWYQGMHIQYFTKSSLQPLLVSEGFEIVGTQRLPMFFSLHSLGQSLNRYELASPFVWLLQRFPKDKIFLRLRLSVEMLMVARKCH